MGEVDHDRRGGDEGAPSRLAPHQPALGELDERAPGGGAAHPVLAHQLRLRRQLPAGGQLTALDPPEERLDELAMEGHGATTDL